MLCNLLGLEIPDLSSISEPTIIVAHDLTPSDTAQLNEYVKGFVTEIGGKTSHSAIMANSLEIPAVVGTAGALDAINNGDIIGLDAIDGEVFVNPDEETTAALKKKETRISRREKRTPDSDQRQIDHDRRS